ncbi:MAG: hypothetical protein PWP03_672 [Candidatus Woesearchaeota archaeon]|nr:hypothetical protein [Candidatus Woesearchaeota archaeon]MDN5328034.1 hypothetical protein [Candidatus Woesearchaeota archaeon]
MYFPKLEEIRHLRLQLNLSQKRLAELAGVSQSIIAKIEKGKVSPSYEIVVKIFLTLESLRKKNQIKAKDVMNKKVVFCYEDSLVKDAVSKMLEKGFSQMPVLSRQNSIVGYISEQILLKKQNLIKEDTLIKEIMERPMPTFDEDISLDIIYEVLEQYPMVIIVSHNGKIEGIITKSDVLKKNILNK